VLLEGKNAVIYGDIGKVGGAVVHSKRVLQLGSLVWRSSFMCRNIKTLFNFAPPATDEEIKAASLQYVRKVTGFNKPSKTNEAAFYSAVEDIAKISERLLASLETTAPPKDREEEAAKAKARSALRFGG
jgi:hypothetical protein